MGSTKSTDREMLEKFQQILDDLKELSRISKALLEAAQRIAAENEEEP